MFWELFVLVSLWECQNLACASIDRTEHGLHKALIERYPSVYARPVFNHTETVRVELGLALIQLNELVDVSHFSNLEDIDLNDYIRHHEWRVVKTYARRNVKYYPCCVEPYLDITYTLILKREGGRFVPMLVAPAVMMSLLLPVMFVLPVESGEKMTLGIGILLVIVLMLDMLNEYIMTSFYTMPLLVSYYIACLILTSISLALSACVVNVAHSKRRMPAWLRKLVLKPLTCVFCVWGTNEEPQSGQAIRFRQLEPEPLDDLSQPSDDRQRFAPSAGPATVTPIAVEEWRRLATALDRLLLCVFLLIDIIMMVFLLPRAVN